MIAHRRRFFCRFHKELSIRFLFYNDHIKKSHLLLHKIPFILHKPVSGSPPKGHFLLFCPENLSYNPCIDPYRPSMCTASIRVSVCMPPIYVTCMAGPNHGLARWIRGRSFRWIVRYVSNTASNPGAPCERHPRGPKPDAECESIDGKPLWLLPHVQGVWPLWDQSGQHRRNFYIQPN